MPPPLLLALAALLAAAPPPSGSPDLPPGPPVFAWGHACTLEAELVNHYTYVGPPPREGFEPRWQGDAPLARSATFQVEYVDFPPEARTAFESAIEIWSRHVRSSVPIRVQATFAALDGNTLASASPRLVANFTTAFDRDTFYPVALANALEGRDLDPANPHIEATFNASFPRWYFGTDGAPPTDRYDFATVALHEIGHGLGFVGSMRVSDAVGQWGLGSTTLPVVYDRFAETDVTGQPASLLDVGRFPNPSRTLEQALTSQAVYFSAPVANRAQVESQAAQGLPIGPGGRPVLHAPQEWQPGSSYNHLTELQQGGAEVYYPPGSLNSLMTPRLGATEVVRTPGPVTCGVFRDLGWPLGDDCRALLDEEPVDFDEALLVVGPCPNPAVGGRSRVGVHVPEPARVQVTLFDMAGRRVAQAFDGRVAAVQPVFLGDRPVCLAGSGSVEIPTEGLASGVYLVRVQAAGEVRSVLLTVIR